jgi:hypothetical protein
MMSTQGIFVSYRRIEGQWADRLSRHLGNRFGNDLVFQDVDDIAGGEKWRDKIVAAIHDAEVILVMIGPYWLVDHMGATALMIQRTCCAGKWPIHSRKIR